MNENFYKLFLFINSRHREDSSVDKSKPSKSQINISKLLGEDDLEMVVLAGDSHEDNKTVIDDIFMRDELDVKETPSSAKPYHDLDLDLGIFGDEALQKGHFHLGMDLRKHDNSLKTNYQDTKDNRHISYINDVMNIESSTQQERLRPRSKSPDSLDSFNFLPDLNEVGGTTEGNKGATTPTNPKHLRTSRQPVSAAKEKPPSIEGGNIDTDSFADL